MKKTTIQEELKRFHEITGKQNVSEGFIDTLLKKVGLRSDDKKVDDPKKADLVSDDVKQFFNTLENIKSDLKQQPHGSMEYQKDVETMQIGLMLLGYDLPKHGVDGLYGPETASAVERFKRDNKIDSKEPINETILLEILKEFDDIKERLDLIQLDDTSYSNVKFDNDNTKYDEVNKPLLDDLQTAANKAGVVATITTAKSGHDMNTVSGNLSRHQTRTAVDIAIIDGVGAGGATGPNNGSDEFREKGNRLKDALLDLGYKLNVESGNVKAVLWQTNTGGNHFNHLHVSNNTGLTKDDTNSSTSGSVMPVSAFKVMVNKLREKNITSEQLKLFIDSVTTGGGAEFTDLDLTTQEGYDTYVEICQKFIDAHGPNPLSITGRMMADGAKQAFEKYQRFVPAELALSQLVIEGGLQNKNTESRPIKTKNPFNVGNTDSGSDVSHNQVQSGINAYYNLIAKDYLGKGKTAKDLITNFVNKSGNRYASSTNYESALNSMAANAHKIALPVISKLSTSNKTDNVG